MSFPIKQFLHGVVLFFSVVNFQLLAAELNVAVASNFKPVIAQISEKFELVYPEIKLVIISGSSGKLYAQIKHGAPFDVFLSADQQKIDRLIADQLALKESRFTYAYGRLVLWSHSPDLVDPLGAVLSGNGFSRLALANAKLAPYGVAAEESLHYMGLHERLRTKWVQGENIAQTYQFIETGNAELGFIALSQVWEKGALTRGSIWIVPEAYYQPIKQDAVILKRTPNLESAKLLFDYLQQPLTRKMIEQNGYQSFP